MNISFKTKNKRLRYDFLESIKEYYKDIKSEYDGKIPIDNLTEEEKILMRIINDKLEKGFTNL